MTYTQVQKLLRQKLKELEIEVLVDEPEITEEDLATILKVAKEKVLTEMGIDAQEFLNWELENKELGKAKSKKKKDELKKELTELEERIIAKIPPEKEIPPPQVINKIVKETVKEKPTIIEKTYHTSEIKEKLDTEALTALQGDIKELQSSFTDLYGRVSEIKIPEIPETTDWTEKIKDLEWRIENINTKRASIFNRSDAGSFTTAISDSRYYKKSEVDALIAGGGSMVYPGAGIALSTGSAWDTSIANNSANWDTAFGWGDHASGGYLKADGSVPLTANWDAGAFEIRAQTLEADVATGTAPLTIASTTLVANLNADLLDSQEGTYYLAWANFTGTPTTLSGYGISDTKANFNTACSDGTFAYSGDNISIFNNDAGYITATLTQEQVEDYVGGMVTGNTETGIAVTYQDADGTLDFVLDSEITDFFGATDITGAEAETLTDGSDADALHTHGAIQTTEEVQDIVGAMFSSNTETLITATYQDADGTIDLIVDNDLANYDNTNSGFITATLTQEEVEDYAGAMVANATGTHTGISITYQDASGDMDFVVDHDAANNFVANEHIDHTAVTLTAGSGLTGGGDISTNRTFDLDINSLSVATIASGDFVPFWDITATATNKKTTFANFEAALTHDNLIAGTIADHDTGATGAELDTLTDGSSADALHTHTGTSISGIDISDDTNLVAGTNITLVDDTLNVDDAFLINSGDDVTTGGITFGNTTGVKVSAATGVLTLAGVGNTNNENLTFDFEGTANTVTVGTGTGVTDIDLSALNVTTTGTITAEQITSTDDITATDGIIAQRIALGTIGLSDDMINMRKTFTDDDFAHMIVAVPTFVTTANDGIVNVIFNFNARYQVDTGITNSQYTAASNGNMLANADHEGTMANVYGFNISIGHLTGAGGTTDNMAGFRVRPYYEDGTIVNYYNMLFTTPNTGGSITNAWSIYDDSGFDWALNSDNQKIFRGAAQDVSDSFDGSDWIFNSENVTANDEVKFQNFDKYNFDNTVNFGYAGTVADTNSPTHINTPTGVAAAQVGWLKVEVNGTTSYIPYWQ